ncbi:ABC transporter ATP-binding protein [Deinococcus peraridilitoris]|uniref:ABC-type nitrate/sulfonate/bicarbonate transport system, ATPase component n=1 Tax=Deinococcus peraridilitoris (strain DSM 19664 / LMG 22246 / CIP 109416 / KR-200) TaxID=937777 RepID=L0A409_DEIPD|nr:ABC transporter ATP-binding protein [Deinococcus peraridilitoris]AFZ67760.1 ABC-type nitrate/sulfonate/bicarbonate transport system, ATPase component [Deinococcus peraridilitoris DSM 19664]
MTLTAAQRGAPPGEAPGAISVRNLNMVFGAPGGDVIALQNANLEIGAGEFISLIGPSGCGKTTLLRLMADLTQPTSGEIRVNGLTPTRAREQRAYGYVFQAPALFEWRSVLNNVTLPLEVMDFPKNERKARAEQMLRLVGLQNFTRSYPWQLSGGMQQRVSIARALAFDPQILLMDEPFGALDEITRENLNMELLRLWRETGKTVVFVTHSISEAVFLSTRVVVMTSRPGKIEGVVDIDLPQPRGAEVRELPRFFELATQVRELLRRGHGFDLHE